MFDSKMVGMTKLNQLAPQGNKIPQCQYEIDTKRLNSLSDLVPIELDMQQSLYQSEKQVAFNEKESVGHQIAWATEKL